MTEIVCVIAAVCLLCVSASHANANPGTLVRGVERISLQLRGHRLTDAENRELQAAVEQGRSPAEVYRDRVDQWLTPEAVEPLLESFLLPMGKPRSSGRFLHLSAYTDKRGKQIYYLPHQNPLSEDGPCPESQQVQTRGWWSREPVTLCLQSYRPEQSFDAVGYCAGQPEPRVPAPPRPGCGCGPALIACLPPASEHPGLMASLDEGMYQEVLTTMSGYLRQGLPFSEMLTGTKTFQTGGVKFLYLRRDFIGRLGKEPYTPALEAEFIARLDQSTIDAPGTWVEREGVYKGAGLFLSTPAAESVFPTYRVAIKELFKVFLCHSLQSIHVTADMLGAVAGTESGNLRAFEAITEDTPMLRATACRGCHVSLDHGSRFLSPLRTALYGGHPTAERGLGQLYLNGPDDFRGEASGLYGLGKLVASQPEFLSCAAVRLFTLVAREPPHLTDRAITDRLAAELSRNGGKLLPVIRSLLLSEPYVRQTLATP